MRKLLMIATVVALGLTFAGPARVQADPNEYGPGSGQHGDHGMMGGSGHMMGRGYMRQGSGHMMRDGNGNGMMENPGMMENGWGDRGRMCWHASNSAHGHGYYAPCVR
jgi:hypothetical protein